MRLLRVLIEDFRSIDDQWLPLLGQVILFGPNSAGKTSVLEAVEELVGHVGTFRTDPGERGDPDADGSVWFDLPEAALAETPDAETYRTLLCGGWSSEEKAWEWLGRGTSDRIRSASLKEALDILVSLLAESGSAGSQPDRHLLARTVLDPAVNFFITRRGAGLTQLTVSAVSMPPAAMDAAERIVAEAASDDPLHDIAAGLISDGGALVCIVAEEFESHEGLAKSFPRVIVLDGDYESLSAELAEALPAIHDALWNLHYPKTPIPFGGYMMTVDTFIMTRGQSGYLYEIDPWLEYMSGSGDPEVPGRFSADHEPGDWVRVRQSALGVARLIEAEANQLAPDFVRAQGRIGIEMLPVAVWKAEGHRIRVTFTEYGGDPRDLNVIGAGTARWAAASVRLACSRLKGGRQVVTDEAGTEVTERSELERLIRAARCEPLTQASVRLLPYDSPACYVVDEPETHLHPSAIISVRDWIGALAASAATVLVATHSPAILGSESEPLTRILVLRDDGGTTLRPLTDDLAGQLDQVKELLGLTKGDLLLLSRLVLFVEGIHDKIILTEWFDDELSAAGIRVHQVRGVDNITMLFESDIVVALGLRIATLSDETSVPRAIAGEPSTRGERAVARMRREAAAAGFQAEAFGLARADILCYLDDVICKEAAPTFPGWGRIDTKSAKWKKAVTTRYGLELTPESIQQIAAECRRRGLIPIELTHVIREIVAYAAKPKSSSGA